MNVIFSFEQSSNSFPHGDPFLIVHVVQGRRRASVFSLSKNLLDSVVFDLHHQRQQAAPTKTTEKITTHTHSLSLEIYDTRKQTNKHTKQTKNTTKRSFTGNEYVCPLVQSAPLQYFIGSAEILTYPE